MPRPPSTVAIKCAEDAKLWGVHLSAAQREVMDALVERLLGLWLEAPAPAGLDAATVFERLLARDPEARRLAESLHFPLAAKRRGFFLQYLADALQREAAKQALSPVERRSE